MSSPGSSESARIRVALARLLRQKGILGRIIRREFIIPTRAIFGFSLPLLSSDVVFLLRTSAVIVLLQYLTTSNEVAAYGAVLPLARQNLVIYQSFGFLFVPVAARLFARGEHDRLRNMYWQTSAWIAVATFPALALTVALAGPLTVLLFGQAYADAGAVLAVLAVGHYVNAALGFNALTLRVQGSVRLHRRGRRSVGGRQRRRQCPADPAVRRARRGRIATPSTLIIQNLLYQAGLVRSAIGLPSARHVVTFVTIAVAITALHRPGVTDMPLLLGLVLAAAVSVGLLASEPQLAPDRPLLPGAAEGPGPSPTDRPAGCRGRTPWRLIAPRPSSTSTGCWRSRWWTPTGRMSRQSHASSGRCRKSMRVGREPDITIRFVDRVEVQGALRLLGREAAYGDDEFLVLRGRRKTTVRVKIPVADIGTTPLEIVAERGLSAVPFLLPIIMLTLLSKGIVPVHASAFVAGGRGTLVTGWAKGGKSEALLAFADRGATYVGDEWVFVTADGAAMAGLPEPMRLWDWQLAMVPRLRDRIGLGRRVRLGTAASMSRLLAGDGRALPVIRSSAPGDLARRLGAMAENQRSLQIPPERVFDGALRSGLVPLDSVVLIESSTDPVAAAEPIDGTILARRTAATVDPRAARHQALYLTFRYAFPERRNQLIETFRRDLERGADRCARGQDTASSCGTRTRRTSRRSTGSSRGHRPGRQSARLMVRANNAFRPGCSFRCVRDTNDPRPNFAYTPVREVRRRAPVRSAGGPDH